MSTKNPYLVELKRYLAEVHAERRSFSLEGLADRVYDAQQHNVSSLDIYAAIVQYSGRAQSSAKYKNQLQQIMDKPAREIRKEVKASLKHPYYAGRGAIRHIFLNAPKYSKRKFPDVDEEFEEFLKQTLYKKHQKS